MPAIPAAMAVVAASAAFESGIVIFGYTLIAKGIAAALVAGIGSPRLGYVDARRLGGESIASSGKERM